MKTRRIIIAVAAISFVILSTIMVLKHNELNFTGVVTNKYIEAQSGTWIQWKNNTVMIDSWFGNKRFLIEDDDLYESIEVGKTYRFKRTNGVTLHVTIIE